MTDTFWLSSLFVMKNLLKLPMYIYDAIYINEMKMLG